MHVHRVWRIYISIIVDTAHVCRKLLFIHSQGDQKVCETETTVSSDVGEPAGMDDIHNNHQLMTDE